MSTVGGPPPARPRPAAAAERFPGRRRLRWLLPSQPPLPEDTDEVSRAARRLRDLLGTPERAADAPAPELETPRVAAELANLDRRLRGLAGRLALDATELRPPAERPAAPRAAALPPAVKSPDEVAESLCQRARGYFDEWRQLLLEESSAAEILEDFAASPYLEQLARHHPRFFLLLDAEGVVLRAGHPERGGAAAQRLTRGSRSAAADLEGLLSLSLGVGRLLVLPEPSP